MDGHRDILGMYIGENESAKFWLSVLNGLKNRGVEDILIVCVDGLSGFPQAIEAVYPQAEIQHCNHPSNTKHHKIRILQRYQRADGRFETSIYCCYRRSSFE